MMTAETVYYNLEGIEMDLRNVEKYRVTLAYVRDMLSKRMREERKMMEEEMEKRNGKTN
jgi:hypothetical protein